MKARVKWVQDVMFVGESGSGHSLVIDGAPDAGGRNKGFRPMELMLLGLGSCSAFDVMMILWRGREQVTDCVVELDGQRADTDPKVYTAVELVYKVSGKNLDRNKVERAVSLSAEKYCSASKMFSMTAKLTHRIEVTETTS
jgi:putative redox protein